MRPGAIVKKITFKKGIDKTIKVWYPIIVKERRKKNGKEKICNSCRPYGSSRTD